MTVVLAVFVVTVGSRIIAGTFLPPPRGAAADIVARLPAPLFAALAALSAVGAGRDGAPVPVVVAAAFALLSTPRRSLLATLCAGLGGFAAATALL